MIFMQMCLCFLVDESSNKNVLLGRKKLGFGSGRIVGLGGHVDAGETSDQAAIREVFEESNVLIDPSDLVNMGLVKFIFPSQPSWNQEVHIYVCHNWHGVPRESEEIEPIWYSTTQLPFAEMWDDAKFWLSIIISGIRIESEITFKENNTHVKESVIRVMGD